MEALGLKNEIELVKRAKNGDRDAFETLIRQNAQKVFDICLTLTNDLSQAEELLSEVFIYAYKEMFGLELKSSFSTWAARLSADLWEKKNRNSEILKYRTEVHQKPLPGGFINRFNKLLDEEIERELFVLQKPRHDLRILVRGFLIFAAFIFVLFVIRYFTIR